MLLLHMAGETTLICLREVELSREFGLISGPQNIRKIIKCNINKWLCFLALTRWNCEPNSKGGEKMSDIKLFELGDGMAGELCCTAADLLSSSQGPSRRSAGTGRTSLEVTD